jgi:periplasmic protein TonB
VKRDRELLSPKDIVLGAIQRPGRRGVVFGSVVAAVMHIGAGAMAFTMGNAERAPARKSRPLVVVNHVVDLEPPKVDEPPPPPPSPPEVKPPPKVKVKQPKAPPVEAKQVPQPDAPESEPPPAAQAAQVVAAEAPGPATFDIATGQGNAYAGGTTSSTGTGKEANHTGQVGTANGNGYNYARPAKARTRDWPCGWPPEAEELDQEEAFVTVQVAVSETGAPTDVRVIADPGHGFGRRVVWCANSKIKYDPALDASGKPVAGETVQMRVRFTRED